MASLQARGPLPDPWGLRSAWALLCVRAGQAEEQGQLAEVLHVADKAFEHFHRPCVLCTENDTMVFSLIY